MSENSEGVRSNLYLDREESKKVAKEMNDTLTDLKDLLKVADYLGVKTENQRGKDIIKYAVNSAKDGHYWEAQDALEEGKRFLKEVLDEKIENELIDLSLSLDEIEDERTSKKANKKIFQIEDAREEERYKDIPELIYKAWDEIEGN